MEDFPEAIFSFVKFLKQTQYTYVMGRELEFWTCIKAFAKPQKF